MPTPPPGSSPYVAPYNTAAPQIINLMNGQSYTSAPTVTISGGCLGAGVKPAAESHTANIPVDPAVVAGITSEVIIAIDVGVYGKKKLICRTTHHDGRSLYTVTHNGETITTTAFVADAVRHYNAIGDQKT